MIERRERVTKALPLLVPLLLFVGSIWFELRVGWLALHEPLGRDQGIFQYVAFALSKGQRDYLDMHEINGPFVHLLSLLLFKLTSGDEFRIRIVDFVMNGVVFFGVGAAIPFVGWRAGDPVTRAPWYRRIVWGLASSSMLWANYLHHNWWDHAQRESIYNAFILASLGLQLYAHIPSSLGPRARTVAFGVCGALSVLPALGKPTNALFMTGQLLGMWVDADVPLPRRRRLLAYVAGAALGCVPVLVYVLVYADIPTMVRFVMHDAPKLYFYIWHKSIADTYHAWSNGPRLNYGIFTVIALVPLALGGWVPRRLLPIVLFLVLSLASYFAQAKGFPYHLQPITAAAFLSWLLLLGILVERGPRGALRWVPRWAAIFGAIGAAIFFAWHCTQEVTLSETARDMPARMRAASTPEGRRTELPRFFNHKDFYALDIREAGWFVRDVTAPSDRVQTWGMDPYVMFFAERLSATPFIYSFEINVDAALAGGSGGAPSASDAAWLRAKSAENARLLFEGVRDRPPAAFVLIDDQPFSYPTDADEDFRAHCPDAYRFMVEHCTRVRRFGAVRVWLRNDLAAKISDQR